MEFITELLKETDQPRIQIYAGAVVVLERVSPRLGFADSVGE